MLTLFFRILGVLCVAWAEAPEPPTHMDYRIDAGFLYFDTETNFNAGGNSSEDLHNDGYFTDMIFSGKYTQDLDKKTRVYGGFTYSMTESYDGFTTRENAGLNELMGGGQYWLKVLGFPVAPAADFVYPLVRVDANSNDALLGEGAMKLRLGTWAMMGRPVFDPFIYLGYEYRDEGRSHAVPYSIGVKWKNKPLWAQAEYRGFERLFAASDTSNRNQRDDFLKRVDGGSFRYYALNQALSEAAFEAGYSFGIVQIYGGAAITVNGSSAADGYTITVGAAYTPGKDDSDAYDRNNPMTDPVDIPDRFTPYVDPIDDLDPTRPPKKHKLDRPGTAAPPKPMGPPPAMTNEDLPPEMAPPPPPAKAKPVAKPPPATPAPPPVKGKVPPRGKGKLTKPALTQPMPEQSGQPEHMQPQPPSQSGQSGGPMPQVELIPANKAAPPAKPAPKAKPKKKNKVDKILDEAEENLKNL